MQYCFLENNDPSCLNILNIICKVNTLITVLFFHKNFKYHGHVTSQNCRRCQDCGSFTPGAGATSRWHFNYTVCDSCYQQRNKGLSCPLCGRAYRHFSDVPMVQCKQCEKSVHIECDVTHAELVPYVCANCRGSFKQVVRAHRS